MIYSQHKSSSPFWIHAKNPDPACEVVATDFMDLVQQLDAG